ncbi:amidohydrolase family protein [Actinacidiphila yeochonensis]|uniref:amidohydrolase family protein n=1 Tax=Actinacidiphila yeochonensis TaxID=89050 RepID=UPI00099D567A|nr:amidohydrolase family protein [Actinacidiphila yeochonensis]
MSTSDLFGAPGRPTEYGRIHPSDEEWLARGTEEAVLEPDLPIVDSHHHLWEIGSSPYLFGELAEDLGSGHRVESTVFVECVTHYRGTGPEELRPVGETEFVVRETSGRPGMADGIVGFADLALGRGVEEVLHAHLSAAPGRFKGIRYSSHWDPSDEIENGRPYVRPGLLAEPAVVQGARVLGELGLSLDALVFHHQLDDVIALADEVPELTIVLNHCGFPLGYGPYAGRRDEVFAAWRASIRRLAERPNVVCKLGGLMSRAAEFDYRTAAEPPSSELLARLWGPWITTCVEEFGAERCLYESNFPVDRMGTTYSTLWNTFKRISSGASADERAALFAGTARRVYRIGAQETR